jgi:DNA-binding transcriptional MerR regulator
MPATTWTITELAAEFGTTLRSIRFYEDQGLLAPERAGLTRVFHPRDRVRLQLILRGKRLGFSLREIASILDMYDEQPGEAGQLRFLLADIAERRTVLQRKRQDLDDAMRELEELDQRCREDLRRLERGAPATTIPSKQRLT